MSDKTITKDPEANIGPLALNWSRRLGSDTISTFTWTAAPGSGIEVHTTSLDSESQRAIFWVRGGKSGTWDIINRIRTAGGEFDKRSIQVIVQPR